MCHDDSIILRVNKESKWKESKRSIHNGNRGFCKLTPDYYLRMYQTDRIIGYWDKITKSKREKGDPNSEPYYSRKIDLGSSTYFETMDSYCELVINDLYTDLKSRYRKGLNQVVTLVDAGIIEYIPRSEPKDRNKLEAVRNRIIRDYWIARYDFNLNILDEKLGLELMTRLKQYDQNPDPKEGTIYLSGFDSNHSTHIMIYNTKYKTGKNIVKIEVKLRRDFLVSKRKDKKTGNEYNLRSPKIFLTQPEIQSFPAIEKELRRCMKLVFGKAELEEELRLSIGCTNKKNLYSDLLSPENTLTVLKQKTAQQDDIEKEEQIKINLERLKKTPVIYKNPDFPTMSEIRRERDLETQELNKALFSKPVSPSISEEVDNSLDAFF